MKEKLTNNWGLKLVSLLLAVFMWLFVINATHPMENRTITVYNVEYRNEDVVIESGRTYTLAENLESRGLVISVPVLKTDANKVRSGDFKIVVDLAKMGPFGAVDVEVEWLGSQLYTIRESDITWRTSTVTVLLEDIIEKTYRVELSTEGVPAQEYILGDEAQMLPRTVKIKAPQSVMEQIHSVGIVVNVEGLNSEATGKAKLKLYDVAGKELNLDYASYNDYEFAISQDEIEYTVPLLKTKEVGLSFSAPVGTVAQGYRYTGMQGANQTVHIAGLRALLAEIASIEIPAEELNLEGARENVVIEIDTSLYVPEGVTVESESVVTVVLQVEPLIRQTRQLQPEQIRMEGGQNGWNYTLQNSVEVVIEGLEEDLNMLSDDQIEAWVSLEGMEAGVNTTDVNVTLDSAFTLVRAGEALVRMEEIPAETGSLPGGSGETGGSGQNPGTGQTTGSGQTAEGGETGDSGQNPETGQTTGSGQNSSAGQTEGSGQTTGAQEAAGTGGTAAGGRAMES